MEPPIAGIRDEDQRTLRRFVAGEPAACRTVERWARTVAFFHGFRLTTEERDEVVQDTLTALWQLTTRPEFRITHGLRALVRTIVSARCIDRARRRRVTVELDDALIDPTPGPLDDALRSDERTRLRAALFTLKEACVELIRAHYFEELSYGDIARREGRQESTLRARMFQCLRALRRRMASMTE